MADYYAQRAGAGLIISEATGISREGLGWPFAPGLWNRGPGRGLEAGGRRPSTRRAGGSSRNCGTWDGWSTCSVSGLPHHQRLGHHRARHYAHTYDRQAGLSAGPRWRAC